MNYIKNTGDIEIGGGDLLVNLQDMTFNDFNKFTSVGATDKDAGATLRIGERKIDDLYNEGSKSEPFRRIYRGQEVLFETTLVESSLQNLVLALGGDTSLIADGGSFKYYRMGEGEERYYPFLYKVPQADNPTKFDWVLMPYCQVIGAFDYEYFDEKTRAIRLTLRAEMGSNAFKVEFRRDK